MAKRKAKIKWEDAEKKWVLYLWIDNEWHFSKSWGVERKGESKIDGAPIDFVNDNILSEIAHMQDLGYEVMVS